MLSSSFAGAEQLKTVFNPFTGKPDYITKIECGTTPKGVQFADANGCTWCQTINTSGVLSTALIACLSSFILMEDGSFILQEDGVSKIITEQ